MPPPTRQSRQRRRVVIGYAVIGLLVATALVIFFLDAIRHAMSDTYTVVGVFSDVQGVERGTDVWLAGYPVGRVTRVAPLPPNHDTVAAYAVVLELPARRHTLVRRDSELRIYTPGLTGNPVVELRPGTSATPPLAPGDTLLAQRRVGTREMLDDAAALSRSLDSLFAAGTVVQSLYHARQPTLELLADRLSAVGAEFSIFTHHLDTGSLGKLMADSTWRASLTNLQTTAAEIAQALEARAKALDHDPLGNRLRALAHRATQLQQQATQLQTRFETEPTGFLTRYRQDPALQQAMQAVRAQLDSLIAETRKEPWRFFF